MELDDFYRRLFLPPEASGTPRHPARLTPARLEPGYLLKKWPSFKRRIFNAHESSRFNPVQPSNWLRHRYEP